MKVLKRNIYLSRLILWGGIALAVIGAVIYYTAPNQIDWCLILLGGGLVVSFLGGLILKRLFRCPNCKKNVLSSDSSIDLKMSNVPQHCPHCGTQIELVD